MPPRVQRFARKSGHPQQSFVKALVLGHRHLFFDRAVLRISVVGLLESPHIHHGSRILNYQNMSGNTSIPHTLTKARRATQASRTHSRKRAGQHKHPAHTHESAQGNTSIPHTLTKARRATQASRTHSRKRAGQHGP